MAPPGIRRRTGRTPVGTASHDRLVRALADARDLPDGPAAEAELQRLLALADAADDRRLGFEIRCALMESHRQQDQWWRIPEQLGWCLAELDHAPTGHAPIAPPDAPGPDRTVGTGSVGHPLTTGRRYDPQQDVELLTRLHRLAVVAFCRTPRVGLPQTRSLLDDLDRRAWARGQTSSAVTELRCRIADHLGDEPAARLWLSTWQTSPDGPCPGCAATRQAELLAGWGDWAAAVTSGESAATTPSTCTDQPEAALTVLLLPYLHLGRPVDAGLAHVAAYRRHRRERAALPYLATHLRFCALGGHPERGLGILVRHLRRLHQPTDEFAAMELAAAGALVCRTAAEAGLGDRTVERPAFGRHPATTGTVTTLGADLRRLAEDLAGQFDARNGTGHQSGRMASWLAAEPVGEPAPLPPDSVTLSLVPTDGGGLELVPIDDDPHQA